MRAVIGLVRVWIWTVRKRASERASCMQATMPVRSGAVRAPEWIVARPVDRNVPMALLLLFATPLVLLPPGFPQTLLFAASPLLQVATLVLPELFPQIAVMLLLKLLQLLVAPPLVVEELPLSLPKLIVPLWPPVQLHGRDDSPTRHARRIAVDRHRSGRRRFLVRWQRREAGVANKFLEYGVLIEVTFDFAFQNHRVEPCREVGRHCYGTA